MDEVESYLNQFRGEMRTRLDLIRNIIHSLAPEASESISYGLVAYKFKGRPLIYFGGFAKHIGLYATPNGHDHFKSEFAEYKQGKGSVQFPIDKPLPEELIKEVVTYRKNQLMK